MDRASELAVAALAILVGLTAYLAGAGWARAKSAAELAAAKTDLARRLRDWFSLQELSYLLSESLDVSRIVEQLARYLIRFLDAGGALVALRDPTGGGWQIAAADGSLAPLQGRRYGEADPGLVAAVLREERLQVAPERSLLVPGVEAHRAALAPLRAHGLAIGAVVAVDPPEPFRHDQLRLLSTVAAHAAVVLANARLFEQLRAGKEQWESTFDALADGIAVVDQEGRIRRANRALAAFLDRPLPEVIGLDLATELLGSAAALADLYGAVRGGKRASPVTRRSELRQRIFRIAAAPIEGEGSPGWIVTLIEDVTEQRAFETQMIQHEKMAAVGQLVSGVAHELNNPLSSVAGLAELLLELPGTSPQAKEHLRIIHEQAERAGKIVRNLLAFARQGPAEVTQLDLNELVQRTALLLEYEVRLREVTLTTELAPEPLMVRADRMQLQQVVVNLLTNAVQAMADNPPDRPRRVTVRTARRGDRVVVEVEDTGPGVPDELASRIFTPFFTTKEPGEGTGLGLAISYSIMERHGGTLSVHRAPDGGARFVAQLPALQRRTGEPAVPQRAAGSFAPPPRVSGSRRVLLVDSDPAVQEMIRSVFSSDGHQVEAARDAVQAVALLERDPYDLVIADPRLSLAGRATLAETLLERWPALRGRTVFATADVRPETEAWLQTLGCRYLHKPLNARQLRSVAAAILEPDQPEPQAAS